MTEKRRRFQINSGIACVSCGYSLDDPKHHIKGFGGVMRHECPVSSQAGQKSWMNRDDDIERPVQVRKADAVYVQIGLLKEDE